MLMVLAGLVFSLRSGCFKCGKVCIEEALVCVVLSPGEGCWYYHLCNGFWSIAEGGLEIL